MDLLCPQYCSTTQYYFEMDKQLDLGSEGEPRFFTEVKFLKILEPREEWVANSVFRNYAISLIDHSWKPAPVLDYSVHFGASRIAISVARTAKLLSN